MVVVLLKTLQGDVVSRGGLHVLLAIHRGSNYGRALNAYLVYRDILHDNIFGFVVYIL